MFKKTENLSFTLVETLVVIVILGLVLGTVYTVYNLSQKAYQEGEKAAELLQNGRVVLERITREIRQAREMVSELSEEEEGATSTIVFEDGHIGDSYHYIHYFQDDNLVKREVIGYYFSGDTEKTLVPWDALPPEGQSLEVQTLEETRIIGEYLADFKIWGSKIISTALILEKQDKTLELRTKIFARNL